MTLTTKYTKIAALLSVLAFYALVPLTAAADQVIVKNDSAQIKAINAILEIKKIDIELPDASKLRSLFADVVDEYFDKNKIYEGNVYTQDQVDKLNEEIKALEDSIDNYKKEFGEVPTDKKGKPNPQAAVQARIDKEVAARQAQIAPKLTEVNGSITQLEARIAVLNEAIKSQKGLNDAAQQSLDEHGDITDILADSKGRLQQTLADAEAHPIVNLDSEDILQSIQQYKTTMAQMSQPIDAATQQQIDVLEAYVVVIDYYNQGQQLLAEPYNAKRTADFLKTKVKDAALTDHQKGEVANITEAVKAYPAMVDAYREDVLSFLSSLGTIESDNAERLEIIRDVLSKRIDGIKDGHPEAASLCTNLKGVEKQIFDSLPKAGGSSLSAKGVADLVSSLDTQLGDKTKGK